MSVRVLVDTDVLIDHLRGHRRFDPDPDTTVLYSVITRAELYAGTNVDEGIVDDVLEGFSEIPIDRSIAQRAGRIRRTTGIRTPDALIAATALDRGAVIATRNRRDFGRVDDLDMLPS